MFRLIAALLLLLVASPVQAQDAPLPSWNAGPTKTAILDFVEAASDPKSPGFVPEADRIAVFDNDGTLWAEQPVYFQFFYAMDTAKARAAADPAWATTPVLKAAAAGDMAGVLSGGEEALVELVMATHSGVTVEAFTAGVATWIKTATHPKTGMPFTGMTYQPMIELLAHLRERGFKTYIVSGGGVDFMRAFTESAYGIPPEQVIGSMGKARFEIVDGVAQIIKDPGIAFIDDKEGKPIGISRAIGKRPIFVAGNSDGDLAMLQWGTSGPGPRLGLIVHHTDAVREWAYDRKSHVGKLDKALDAAAAAGWIVVNMAVDWGRIYTGETR
jgi:phosphoglycolate phosphatase-like HAD superfamily hydrolase